MVINKKYKRLSKTVELILPSIRVNPMPLLRYKLEKRNNKEIEERIKTAMGFIKLQTSDTYDLLALTKEELFELKGELKNYIEDDSAVRMNQMLDFIYDSFSEETWQSLSESEKNTIYYSRRRDFNSTSEKCKRIKPERENNLAKIILKTHPKMMTYNSQFRQKKLPDFVKDIELANAKAYFFVEKFLIQDIASNREPVYTQMTVESLSEFNEFHKLVRSAVSSEEVKTLKVNYHVRKMNDLHVFYIKYSKLSFKQRNFATNLMNEYLSQIQTVPEEYKTKIIALQKIP
ncbi:MAG: hypothetical protein U9R34_04395 [Nanoarchaeota archaeon]|nr:hypothetical protein [Nanoarchaeota archaeon]